MFLAGDSTCANGFGNDPNSLWGWGSFFGEYLTDAVSVNNMAISGLSSRTFFDNGQWGRLRDSIQPGDFVLIQFGHNDMSPINTGRARGSLEGVSDTPQNVVMEQNGAHQDVYSFGHYIRMMIHQAKLRGATPIVVSPTPQSRWEGGKIQRFTDTYNAWSRQVAAEEGVAFVDLNDLLATEYEKMGKTVAEKDYFADVVHTRENGARFYCQTLAGALRDQKTPLAKYVK